MAHVDREQMTMIWRAMHGWQGFRRVISEYRDSLSDWLDEVLADILIEVSREVEAAGEPFPEDPESLAELLNERISGRNEAA